MTINSQHFSHECPINHYVSEDSTKIQDKEGSGVNQDFFYFLSFSQNTLIPKKEEGAYVASPQLVSQVY